MNIDKEKLLKESKNFCMAPWIHMHVWPDGRAFPCCLSEPHSGVDYGNTNFQTIEELWNSDLARTLRKNMLEDKPSQTCRRCYQLENDADAYTLRINMNNKFGPKHFDKVFETKEDGSHDNPNFTYMDFRFSNLCNMKCRSCGPVFSTQWYDDFVTLFGKENVKEQSDKKYLQLKDKPGFMEELWPLLDTVEEVYWAGGEPLITDAHWDIMNHWVETGRSQEITINYTTNFSQLYYKRQCVLDLWKKFKNVTVTASLDGSYGRGEFIRKGTVWQDIIDNRKLMIEQTPDIEFNITPTVSLMNVWHLPDFHREWVELGLIKPDGVRLNNLLDPKYLSMQVLPSDFKQEVTEKWINHIEWITNHEDYDKGTYWNREAQGLVDFLNADDLSDIIPETIKQFEIWDKIRNESWETAMPELKILRNSI